VFQGKIGSTISGFRRWSTLDVVQEDAGGQVVMMGDIKSYGLFRSCTYSEEDLVEGGITQEALGALRPVFEAQLGRPALWFSGYKGGDQKLSPIGQHAELVVQLLAAKHENPNADVRLLPMRHHCFQGPSPPGSCARQRALPSRRPGWRPWSRRTLTAAASATACPPLPLFFWSGWCCQQAATVVGAAYAWGPSAALGACGGLAGVQPGA
jgi:hypothetical protein